jgi:hypothetical protein
VDDARECLARVVHVGETARFGDLTGGQIGRAQVRLGVLDAQPQDRLMRREPKNAREKRR